MRALRPFGDMPAAAVTPNVLRDVRLRLARDGSGGRGQRASRRGGLTRQAVNEVMSYVVGFDGRTMGNGRGALGVFRWAAERERVPAEVWRNLCAVGALTSGQAADDEGVIVPRGQAVRDPVPIRDVARAMRHLPRPLRLLVALLWSCGARAGEVVDLRPSDLERDGDVWLLRVAQHKNAHRGQQRVIAFGPRGQRILARAMEGRDDDAPLFSAREGAAEMKRRSATKGKPRRPDQKPNPRMTDRTIGEAYTVASAGRALARACDRAGVPRWTLHQLRHSRGHALYERLGDLASVGAALGHADPRSTARYARHAINGAAARAAVGVARLAG